MDESEVKKNKNFYFIKIKYSTKYWNIVWRGCSIELELYLSGKIERNALFSTVQKNRRSAFPPSTQCNKRARMIQGCAKKRKKWALEKFYGIYIHICTSEIYRALAASALKYGRFIWFSSYVRHKFPLNLEFRSRAHQPTLPRHLPSPS